MFWILIALISAATALYLIAPFAQATRPRLLTADRALKKHYFKQLTQLETQFSQNQLSEKLYLAEKKELAFQLGKLDTETHEKLTETGRLWGQYLLILLIPIGGLCGYFTFGAPRLLDMPAQNQVQVTVPENVQKTVSLLRDDLTKNPRDLQALLLLAEFERTQNNIPEALALYKRAVAVSPTDVQLLEAFLDLQFSTQKSPLSAEQIASLQNLYLLDPANKFALFELGRASAQQKDYRSAEQTWLFLKNTLSPNDPLQNSVTKNLHLVSGVPNLTSEDQDQIDQMVDQLRSKFTAKTATPAQWQLLLTSYVKLGKADQVAKFLQNFAPETPLSPEVQDILFTFIDQHIAAQNWMDFPFYTQILSSLQAKPPYSPTLSYHLGLKYQTTGQLNLAIPFWSDYVMTNLSNPFRQAQLRSFLALQGK